ncbi:hypothetical protein HZS_522 [Henneguya salminicola]|nr:hypothetical protein HZS_522 [Henneguya salminicola]
MAVIHGSLRNITEHLNNNFLKDKDIPHLAKFLIAKEAVNAIFNETETFMKDVYEFYKSSNVLDNPEFTITSLLEEIISSINRIKVIRTILLRDSMKDLRQLGSALSNSTLGPKNLINVYWPIEKSIYFFNLRCPILKHQVSFLDSPGIDVDYDVDTWINQYCRDADVFVLVVNSESTLNNSEKKFFHEVNKYISSPNIFILNNRWDASAHEPEIEAIKAQHLKRSVDFLSKELKCMTHDEAIERVYFTSALEALYAKTKSLNDTVKSFSSLFTIARYEEIPGYSDRIKEFLKFENKLQISLYKSAISTKFSSHCFQADSILTNVADQLDKLIKIMKIKNILTSNEMIYIVLRDEISRFNDIVRSFEYPFSSEPAFIEIYKKVFKLKSQKQELLNYIEDKIEKNFLHRISSELSSPILELQNKIQDFALHTVKDGKDGVYFVEHKARLLKYLHRMSADRRESEVLNDSIANISTVEVQSRVNQSNSISTINDKNPLVQKSIENLSSTITTSTCIFIGMSNQGAKIIGYRVITYIASFMVFILSVKWLLWTNSAKQDAFIRQFVFYAEKRLTSTFKLISLKNGKMVERTLNDIMLGVKLQINSQIERIDQDIKYSQNEIIKIENLIDQSITMRYSLNNYTKKKV